jgi:hypothetical protein
MSGRLVSAIADDSGGVVRTATSAGEPPFFDPAQAQRWCAEVGRQQQQQQLLLKQHHQQEAVGRGSGGGGSRALPLSLSMSSFEQARPLPLPPDLLQTARFCLDHAADSAMFPDAPPRALEQLQHYQAVVARLCGFVNFLGAHVAALGVHNEQLVGC